MNIGPNMTRLRDSAVGPSLVTCVVAGPGDLLVWEVRVTIDSDGLPLEVSGRGTDLESAAAAAMPLLNNHSTGIFSQPEVSQSE